MWWAFTACLYFPKNADGKLSALSRACQLPVKFYSRVDMLRGSYRISTPSYSKYQNVESFTLGHQKLHYPMSYLCFPVSIEKLHPLTLFLVFPTMEVAVGKCQVTCHSATLGGQHRLLHNFHFWYHQFPFYIRHFIIFFLIDLTYLAPFSVMCNSFTSVWTDSIFEVLNLISIFKIYSILKYSWHTKLYNL